MGRGVGRPSIVNAIDAVCSFGCEPSNVTQDFIEVPHDFLRRKVNPSRKPVRSFEPPKMLAAESDADILELLVADEPASDWWVCLVHRLTSLAVAEVS
jgi:hypothetical protein